MKLLFITTLLVVWMSPMESTPCKTVVRVKQEAMEYACKNQKVSFQNAFGLIPIPSTVEKRGGGGLLGGLLGVGTSLVGNVLNLVGIKIYSVQLPEINVRFMPRVGLQVALDTSLHMSANIIVAGQITIKAGAGVTADLKVSRTPKGFPIIEVSACKTLVGGVQITAGGRRYNTNMT
ncbi:hypothetical protein GDO81_017107 [Engystomops pustulosus]|uniref:Lipid-binding serum glycoprotein N-terminal domain-containing protein n=1 Tax=Engystomops pustulosus TaxID=76066 RepID=A0AAV7AAS0_ENGPU|nr:hypothetical protein GDO81_017107 [Engystomops pustulosus]